jgi:ribosomal protein S18 acetylase RimI-like enzyme
MINSTTHNQNLVIEKIEDPLTIIQVLHAAYKRYECDPIPSSALLETEHTIIENLQHGITIFSAKLRGEVVGIVKYQDTNEGAYFSRLAVLPSFQGQGIASKLIHFLTKHAHSKKHQTIYCKVRKSEPDNVRLYKKSGFFITKEEHTKNPNEVGMDVYTMHKIISPNHATQT